MHGCRCQRRTRKKTISQEGNELWSGYCLKKKKLKKYPGCWNAMDGSSAREPGISAAGQESESKLRFGGRDCGRN